MLNFVSVVGTIKFEELRETVEFGMLPAKRQKAEYGCTEGVPTTWY